jgi:serine/threonine protein kinase
MSDPFLNPPPDDDRTVIRPTSSPAPARPLQPAGPATTEAPAAPPAASNDRENTLPVGTYVGEFEITDLLGVGGFGIVYLAWDHSLERKVALKEYMPSALSARGSGLSVTVKSARHQETFEAGLRSFVNEAKLLAQFDHPSMVKVYRFWEANGTAYMVMPFYEGVTLKDTLKNMGSPPDEAWLTGILAPVSEALEVLHDQQCYHRDIAPDNIILLKGSGKPLLLDFGAARRVIGDMTQALTVILKSGYAPVEQYAEVPGMNQGPWTDVYALAASVYYAINGKTPPPAVGRLVNDSFVPLAQSAAGPYSERFLKAIDRALAVKPEDRTQNMAELRQDLGLRSGSTAHAALPPRPATSHPGKPSPGGSSKRTPLILGAGALAVAVIGGIGYLLMGGSEPAPASSVAAAPAPALESAQKPVPVATAAPAEPFHPVTELQRIVKGASAGFTVEATATKPRFKIGTDRLSFSFTSSKTGYAYVLLVSTDGSFMKLYPNKLAKPNRVNAGEHINLPHATWPLDVAGPAGTDHFVVIVSTHPRDFSALGEVNEGGFTQFPRDQAVSAYMAYRGPGSAFAGKAVCDAGISPCADDYGAAYFTLEEYE